MSDSIDVTPRSEAALAAAALRDAVVRGSAWTFAGFGAAQALRLATSLVMSRLLFPEAFGLMSLVMVLMTGIELFSDLGIGPAIVQHERGEQRSFLGTAFTIQMLRGVLVFGAAALAAPAMAAVYGEPQLTSLVIATALGSAIAGINSPNLFLAQRHLAVGAVTVIELAAQVAGAIAMIGYCAVDRSVWALVVGGLASTTVRALLSHFALPEQRVPALWDRRDARSILSFGQWILVSTLLTFLATQADRLVFGRMMPLDLLGVYSIATMIAALPRDVLGRITVAVAFPLYSRVLRDGASLAAPWLTARRWGLLGLGIAYGGLFAGGPAIAQLLYDPRYDAAGWMLRIVAAGGWLFGLEAMNGAALLARGDAQWVAAGNGAKLAAIALLVPAGYAIAGLPGAIAGFAVSESARYGVSVYAVRRLGLFPLRQDLLATAALGVATALAEWAEIWLAGHGAPPFERCAAVGGMLVVLWVPLFALLDRAFLRKRSAA